MIPFLSLKSVTDAHSEEIHEAVSRVVDSGWYLQGKENEAFEQEYAAYIGTKYAVGCANGLDALIWIIRAYKELGCFRDGDEVLVPANTYIATILAITENNLKAVLVEPRADTLEIDDTILAAHLTDRTRAVMIVHLYGRNACSERIVTFCSEHGLKLFEDNAQAHGCRWNGKLTGSLGDASAHSFYPGKNLGALGDAGAITTDDKDVADCVRALGNYGSTRKYVFRYAGRNSRLDEIQAAVLRVKLRYLDQDDERRRDVAERYYAEISNPLVKLPAKLPRSESAYHLFPVLCEKRGELQAFLKERGVQTLIHYPIPPHQQECYQRALKDGLLVLPASGLPVTERIHREELSLPIGPTISDAEVGEVIAAVDAFGR